MKQYKIKLFFPIFLIASIVFSSCNNEMKEHYNSESEKALIMNIMDYIKTDSSISKFYQMLIQTRYDSVLNAQHTYTIWAPDNNALQNVDMADSSLVQDIVKNHISRFLYSARGRSSDRITSLCGKRHTFVHDGNDMSFSDIDILKPGILTSNGIIYTISGFARYYPSIFEFIERTPGLDSLKKYLISQNVKKFIPELNTVIGINESGDNIYDSLVFVSYNKLCDGGDIFMGIGSFYNEDSTYTAILPDNDAWNEAYNRIKTYFVSNDPLNAAKIQDEFTKYVMVQDIIFRGLINNPESYDSLRSTIGHRFYKPSYLFNNMMPTNVSNGLVYVTNKLLFPDTISWFGKIRVEGEYSSNYTKTTDVSVSYRSSFGSGFDLSQDAYLVVKNTKTSTGAFYVEFSIPFTLSATYNIYAVFAPNAIIDTSDHRPLRVSFTLSAYTRELPNVEPKLIKDQSFSTSVITTIKDSLTKVPVKLNHTFKACDYDLTMASKPHIKLRVINASFKPTDIKKYSDRMLIDCIILEPVAK